MLIALLQQDSERTRWWIGRRCTEIKSMEEVSLFSGKQKETISAGKSREGSKSKVHFSTSNYFPPPHTHSVRIRGKLKCMKIEAEKLFFFLKSFNLGVWVVSFRIKSQSISPWFCFEMHILTYRPEDSFKVLLRWLWVWGIKEAKGSTRG